MPLPLPNLDTRRFADLVDDAHALIPRYAPAWTDFNESDPGITLVELLAWLVEQDIYRANRIPERHRRKFLALAGVEPAPPRAARAVLGLAAAADVTLPAGTVFTAGTIPFTTRARVHVAATALAAVQSWDGSAYADTTAAWADRLSFPAWGDDPSFGGSDPPALLFGFDRPLPTRAFSLWLAVEGGDVPGEAQEIADEDAAQQRACARLRPRTSCGTPAPEPPPPCGCDGALETVWEIWDGHDWRDVPARDETRGLLLDGLVRLIPPVPGEPLRLGAVAQPYRWIRCRAAEGSPDAAPAVRGVAVNAVAVEQRVPASTRLALAAGCDLPATPLVAGERSRLLLEFDAAGDVTRVRRTASPNVPKVRVLDVAADSLEATLVVAGGGLGIPELDLQARPAPVADGSISVWSDEDAWTARVDLDAALPRDRVFVLDAQTGTLSFGDGERGLAPRSGTTLFAAYDTTLAAAGNVPSSATWTSEAFPAVTATPAGAALGGADAEDVRHAAGRAAATLWAHERLLELAGGAATLDGLDRAAVVASTPPERAATGLDFERLALTVPGARVARARCWPDFDAGSPGLRAPGTVTVAVVNTLPRARPQPSAALLARVDRYLRRRKTLGVRLVVSGPEYVEVTVTATVTTVAGADTTAVQTRAVQALGAFIDPLRWPFGRDVFRAEVLALLDGLEGVDAVTALELAADGEDGSCGNVCVGPTQLAVSGAHVVEVTT